MPDIHIPREWRKVLRRVQSVAPGAVILGGCLRDLFYDRKPKDIDIFIPAFNDNDADRIKDDLINLFPETELVDKPEYPHAYIYHDMKFGRDYQYDFIICTPQGADTTYFDMSINMIGFDGTEIKMRPQFRETAITKVITVEDTSTGERMQKRIAKIKEKFPTFELKEPEVVTLEADF